MSHSSGLLKSIFGGVATAASFFSSTRRSTNGMRKRKQEKFFEVHVLIKPHLHQSLQIWVNSNKSQLLKEGFLNVRYMATRTSTGVARVQPMVTCLVRVKNHKESIEWTKN